MTSPVNLTHLLIINKIKQQKNNICISQIHKRARETVCTACRCVFVRTLFPETSVYVSAQGPQNLLPPGVYRACVYSVCLLFKDLSYQPKTGLW